jgi:lipid-binding SYLF domain-containing protein
MHKIRRTLQNLLVMAAATASLASIGNQTLAATAEDLNHDAAQALQLLYRTSPEAAALGKRAMGILVFPNVIKTGLVFRRT